MHLLREKRLSVSSLKGYRATIASVLRPLGRAQVLQSVVLADLIRAATLEAPRRLPTVPTWQLGVVLEHLKRPPYEPLKAASLLLLGKKTLFLLAMASAGRRSEFHALLADPDYTVVAQDGSSATLHFPPQFLKKNQRPGEKATPWFVPAYPMESTPLGPLIARYEPSGII